MGSELTKNHDKLKKEIEGLRKWTKIMRKIDEERSTQIRQDCMVLWEQN